VSAMPTCLTAHVCGVDGVYGTSRPSVPHLLLLHKHLLFLYKVVTPTSTVNVPLTGYDRVEVLVRVILSDLPLRLNQLQTWKLSQRRER
jgi:hypothetical protein